MLFNLSIKALLFPLLCALILAGCAGAAPKLPEDYGSYDVSEKPTLADFDPRIASLTCAEIRKELGILNDEVAFYESDIKSKRHQNQTAGYIGVFFLPALIATDNSDEAKEKIREINDAKDVLYKLQSVKKCRWPT